MKEAKSKMALASEQARESGDLNFLIDAIPYAKMLGMKGVTGDKWLFLLPPKDTNIGNPTLPALHGGAVGGFLEMAASLHLIMKMDVVKMPKVVDFSIDYLRPARFKDLYARCSIQRFGSKLINISVESWQDDESVIIAKARTQLLID